MNSKKTAMLRAGGLALLLAAAAYLGPAQGQQSNSDLPNFQKIDEHLYRGAQPTPAGIIELGHLNVGTVLDLRADDGRLAAEKELVEAAGMKFASVPLSNWRRPRNADVEKILRIIADPENQPVFIHCRRGADRTGLVAAVYRITHYDWTAQQALAEAKAHRIGWWQFWMKDYIEDYYRTFRQKSEKPVVHLFPEFVRLPLGQI